MPSGSKARSLFPALATGLSVSGATRASIFAFWPRGRGKREHCQALFLRLVREILEAANRQTGAVNFLVSRWSQLRSRRRNLEAYPQAVRFG